VKQSASSFGASNDNAIEVYAFSVCLCTILGTSSIRGSHRSNLREVVAASGHSSLSTRVNRAVVAPIMFVNASDGGAEAIETFARSTRGLDVAKRSIGCIAIVRSHVASIVEPSTGIRRRAVDCSCSSSDETGS
jgi:hypothetical protein